MLPSVRVWVVCECVCVCVCFCLLQAGMTLSVDMATWSDLWNMTLLGESTVTSVMTMQTYAGTYDEFVERVDAALEVIPSRQLAVGLCTECGKQKMTGDDVMQRLDYLDKVDVKVRRMDPLCFGAVVFLCMCMYA